MEEGEEEEKEEEEEEKVKVEKQPQCVCLNMFSHAPVEMRDQNNCDGSGTRHQTHALCLVSGS